MFIFVYLGVFCSLFRQLIPITSYVVGSDVCSRFVIEQGLLAMVNEKDD